MNAPSDRPAESAVASLPCAAWLCYILRCADGTLYTGITNDMDKRLAAHNAGRASKYTRARRPLVFVESCACKPAALKREMEIKGLSRAEKLILAASKAR